MPRGSVRVAWGELAVVTALAALVGLYLFDARRVSLSVHNLLLVQPTALLVLGLWAVIALGCIRRGVTPPAGADQGPADRGGRWREVGLVGVFGLFILGLERIGYDIAMALFVAAALWIGGERKPLPLIAFPLVFTALVILGFRALVPFPFPTTLL